MKRILGAILIVLFGLSAFSLCPAEGQEGGTISPGPVTYPEENPASDGRYKMAGLEVRIICPLGWKRIGPTGPDEETSSIVFHPAGENDFKKNIAMAVTPLKAWSVKSRGKKALEEVLANLKTNQISDAIISHENISFAGTNALQLLSVSTPKSERQVKSKIVIFIVKDKTFTIACSAPQDHFESLLPTFEATLKTFVLGRETKSKTDGIKF